MFATGFVMMMAGAAMAPTRAAEMPQPKKNGRDLLWTQSIYTITGGDHNPAGGDDHHDDGHNVDGYAMSNSIFDHFSSHSGYQGDTNPGDSHVQTDQPFDTRYGSTLSRAECSSYASAHAFSSGIDAHIGYTKTALMEFCQPSWGGAIKHLYKKAEDVAHAVAEVVTSSQAACVSEGNAFGCASATALGVAWAEAQATAHVTAVAEALSTCQEEYHCPIHAYSLSIAHAETFIQLSAEVFSHAEVFGCSHGDSYFYADAYSHCVAVAYAKIWTEALAEAYLQTDCANADAATRVYAEARSNYYVMDGCDKSSSAHHGGDDSFAAHTTTGSFGVGDAYEFFRH